MLTVSLVAIRYVPFRNSRVSLVECLRIYLAHVCTLFLLLLFSVGPWLRVFSASSSCATQALSKNRRSAVPSQSVWTFPFTTTTTSAAALIVIAFVSWVVGSECCEQTRQESGIQERSCSSSKGAFNAQCWLMVAASTVSCAAIYCQRAAAAATRVRPVFLGNDTC